jgi:hypothetical protein
MALSLALLRGARPIDIERFRADFTFCVAESR